MDVKDEPVAADDPLAAIVASSFKLPDFYRHRPAVWFSYVESQFLLYQFSKHDNTAIYIDLF